MEPVDPRAVGIGLATVSLEAPDQPLLDVRFLVYQRGSWTASDQLGPAFTSAGTHMLEHGDFAQAEALAGFPSLAGALIDDEVRRVRTALVSVVIEDVDKPPVDAGDVYLRLHLLSARLAVPHSLNLDGVFGLLRNVVWTNHGPCDADGFDATRVRLWADGRVVNIYGVDKFPRMVDYVVPSGVRIADADRVRLGAHLHRSRLSRLDAHELLTARQLFDWTTRSTPSRSTVTCWAVSDNKARIADPASRLARASRKRPVRMNSVTPAATSKYISLPGLPQMSA